MLIRADGSKVELPPAYLTLTDDLRALTLEITMHTIFKARHSDFMTNNGMIKYARQIAKELKRPFVPYYKWKHHTTGIVGLSIDVPNKKFLAPIHAPLQLISTSGPNRSLIYASQFGDHLPLVTRQSIKSYTSYVFNGGEGIAFFEDFLARTQQDPDMRKALKLPPQ